MGRVEQRVGVADVLGTTADSGEVRCKLGYHFDETGIDNAAPAWGLDGFISRPSDPSSAGAAQAFFVQDANRRYVVSLRDNRFASKVGTLDPGDRAIVTDGEARVLLKQQRDAVVLYTENAPADKSMMVDLGGADGTIKITNGRCALTMFDDGVDAYISLTVSGGATLTMKSDGTVSLDGAYFNCATGGGRLGVLAPQVPGPPAPAGSIVYGPTGMAAVASTSWTVTP